MDEKEAEAFRLKVRVLALEQLVLRQALAMKLLVTGTTLEEAYREVDTELRQASRSGYRAFGATGDPGMTALYGDEVERVYEEIRASVRAQFEEVQRMTRGATT